MFFKGSRYQFVETNQITGADRRVITYKKTRFIEQPAVHREYVVTQSDRIDLIAYQFLRDPELFWRVCDANYALWPLDLLALSGRRISIPDPQS